MMHVCSGVQYKDLGVRLVLRLHSAAPLLLRSGVLLEATPKEVLVLVVRTELLVQVQFPHIGIV